jgi:hypothetical protein
LGKQDARGFREEVAAEKVKVGGTEAAGGADEVTFFDAEHDAADEAGRASPADDTDDDDDEEESLHRADGKRKEGAERKKKIEPGESEEKFGETHEKVVAPAAEETSGEANDGAEGQDDGGAEEAGEERDLTAIENTGEEVAAEGIGAEEIEAGRRAASSWGDCGGGTEKVKTHGEKAEEMISGCAGKEMERDGSGKVFLVLIEGVGREAERIEKWTEMKTMLGVEEMHAHGRQIGMITILIGGVVGGKEASGEDEEVKCEDEEEPARKFAVRRGENTGEVFAERAHWECSAVRMRGSAR